MSGQKNHYEVLGIAPDSEPEVIEAAYRALIKKHHPDKQTSGASHAFASQLNEAYRILADPNARAAYDEDLRGWGSPLSRDAVPTISGAQPRKSGCNGTVLLLVGAGVVGVILLSQYQSEPSPSADNVLSVASSNVTTPVEEVGPPQAVDEVATRTAARHVRLAVQAEGLDGAKIYSLNCYASVARDFSWARLDRCAVFDAVTRIALVRDPLLSGTESPYFAENENKARFQSAVPAEIASSESVAHHYSLLAAAAILEWRPIPPRPVVVEDREVGPDPNSLGDLPEPDGGGE